MQSAAVIDSYGTPLGEIATRSPTRTDTLPAVPTTRPSRCMVRQARTTCSRSLSNNIGLLHSFAVQGLRMYLLPTPPAMSSSDATSASSGRISVHSVMPSNCPLDNSWTAVCT